MRFLLAVLLALAPLGALACDDHPGNGRPPWAGPPTPSGFAGVSAVTRDVRVGVRAGDVDRSSLAVRGVTIGAVACGNCSRVRVLNDVRRD